jgi:hypothetical protein
MSLVRYRPSPRRSLRRLVAAAPQLLWAVLVPALLCGCHLIFPFSFTQDPPGDGGPIDGTGHERPAPDQAVHDGARVDGAQNPDLPATDTSLQPDMGKPGWKVGQAGNLTLWGVHGLSTTDVWAVGMKGTTTRFDGNTWTKMANSHSTSTLFAVHGTAPGEVYAVGQDTTTAKGIVIKFNGAKWSQLPSVPLPQGLSSFRGVWSVGSQVFLAGVNGTLLRGYGSTWSQGTISIPNTESFNAVWAMNANDAVAVGKDKIRVFNATGWYDDTPLATGNLWGVRAGCGQAYAVGGQGMVLHHNGTNWKQVATGVTTATLHGVWCDGTEVYVVGTGGTILYSSKSASWSKLPAVTSKDLHAIWATGPKDIFVVGRDGVFLRFR